MTHKDQESEEFRKYREQMHGSDEEKRPAIGGNPNMVMRAVFAIIMIIIYIGVGVLLLINFFQWPESIGWIRWIIGIVLIIYGGFRAYRYFAGVNN